MPPALPRVVIKPLLFGGLVALAVALRLAGLARPVNFDQESWSLVADLVLDGKNVYAATDRYNYGPVWMGVLAALKWIAGDAYFRLAVCLALSAVDVVTAMVLRARGMVAVSVLFLFSPWTVFATGYQHMFDNAALLIGLVAVSWVEGRMALQEGEQRMSALSLRDTFIGAVLIGCSLATKHILWLFPVWMAFRTRNLPRRLVWLCIPIGIFLLSFAPFWGAGSAGIVKNVFHYAGGSHTPIFNMLAPNIVDLILGCGPHPKLARVVFGGSLILAGALLRRHTLFEYYLAYLLFVVVLSSAVWHHLLVIPVLFTLIHFNVWSKLFHILAIPFYILHDIGFNVGDSLPPAWRWLDLACDEYFQYPFLTLLILAYLQAYRSVEIGRGWQRVKGLLIGALRGDG